MPSTNLKLKQTCSLNRTKFLNRKLSFACKIDLKVYGKLNKLNNNFIARVAT